MPKFFHFFIHFPIPKFKYIAITRKNTNFAIGFADVA